MISTLRIQFIVLLAFCSATVGCGRQEPSAIVEARKSVQEVGGAESTNERKTDAPLSKPVEAGKKADSTEISAATVEAFKKLGADYGGWNFGSSRDFSPYPSDGLPVFRFTDLPKSKLPDVERPFGLDLKNVSPAELETLTKIKSLVRLDLPRENFKDDHLKVLGEQGKLHIMRFATTVDGKTEPKSAEEVSGFDLAYTKVSDASLKHLTALVNLKTLRFYDCAVTDSGLKELASLKNLEHLALQQHLVTDIGLKELKVHKKLKRLDLSHVKTGDAGMKEIAQMDWLTELDLTGTEITDAGLKELAPLKKLTVLELNATKVTDAGMKAVIQFPALEQIGLSSTRVKSAGFKELAVLKNLNWIGLLPNQIEDETLQTLGAMKLIHLIPGAAAEQNRPIKSPDDVVTLKLWHANLADAGMKELAPFKNLTSLELYNTKVGDVGMKVLSAFPKLVNLQLGGTHVTDDGMKEVAKLPLLDSLNLKGTKVGEKGIKELAAAKKLTSLSISDYLLTDATLRTLRECNMLHIYDGATGNNFFERPKSSDEIVSFGLSFGEFTPAGLKELAGLKNLSKLWLGNSKLNDAGLKEVAGFRNLRELSLGKTQVTDAGLKELSNLNALTQLDLSDTKVTDPGVAELQKALPKCKISR